MDESITAHCGAVLILEDQDDIRQELRALLMEDGYRVHEARDREGALRVLAGEPAHCLVLADPLNPGLSSQELIGLLRPADVLVTIPMEFSRVSEPERNLVGRPCPGEPYLRRRPVNLDGILELVDQYFGV